MFKKFLAAAVTVVLVGFGGFLSAGSAHAATSESFPAVSVTTELSPVVYGHDWVGNDFNGWTANNTIMSVFSDVGAARSFFSVERVTGASVPGFGGDTVVTVKDEHGAFLSDWNNTTPTMQNWRGRFDYTATVDGQSVDPATWFVVVPNVSGSFDLVSYTSAVTSNHPLALTVAQGNSVVETNGTPAWSDTVYLPYNADDRAQQWNGFLPTVRVPHPDLVVSKVESFSKDGPYSRSLPSVLLPGTSDMNVFYKVYVKNVGPGTATNMDVTDTPALAATGGTLLSGHTLVSPSVSLATCEVVGATATQDPDVLFPGQTEVCTGEVMGSAVESALTTAYGNDLSALTSVSLSNVATANSDETGAVNSNTVVVLATSKPVLADIFVPPIGDDQPVVV